MPEEQVLVDPLTTFQQSLKNAIPPFSRARMVGNTVRSVNYMIMGSLPHLFWYEESFFIRSNALWNNKSVDRYSASPQMVVLTEAFNAAETNPNTE